jgi:hypothetical protein
MADYLGARHNPKSDYENDVCIYVKTTKFHFVSTHSYIDVHDAPRAIEFLKEHPWVGVISYGEYQRDYLVKVLKRNDIFLIPHHHCNFERWVRPDREVKVVGIIGNKNSFQYPIDDIRKKLKDIGLELKYEEDYWNYYKEDRQKVIDFYKSIDIQIVWRPNGWSSAYEPLRNPLKLSNAGSFGIPTVSYPEPDYVKEWEGCFISANDIDYLIGACQELKKNNDYYEHFAMKSFFKASLYHIELISELYLDLE